MGDIVIFHEDGLQRRFRSAKEAEDNIHEVLKKGPVLPKEERFKWENIILEGIVPEMAKEPKSLNTFLEPIVDELKVLWKGVKLSTSQSSIPLKYRGALILV